MAWAGPATPDRRLASLFARRSTTEPSKASSVGILSTQSRTRDGVANFTTSLAAALMANTPGLSVEVVRVASTEGLAADGRAAARALNKFDVAIIQHEHGGHRGDDGDRVLEVLEWLLVPVVVVMHTVPATPDPHQLYVLEMLTQSADAVVTMSQSGRRRLLDDYRVEPRKLMLIPHGAPVADEVARPAGRARRPMVLTWGVLGPGKGVEWGIDALSEMNLLRPRPRYVVAGQMEPEGDGGYLQFLKRRAQERSVGHMVEFEPGFISPERLRELLREADVVLLPYDSHEQVTSGVLVESLAAMVPVVCTAFPHAVDLLRDGQGGTVVPHGDSAAIAAAVTRIAVEPAVAAAMSAHNATLTSLVGWPTVAGQYLQLFHALTRRPSAASR